MKILFLTSYYSGLKQSVETGIWNPKGMPAIYKLLNGLYSSNINFDYSFINYKNSRLSIKSVDKYPDSKFYIFGVKNPIPIIGKLKPIRTLFYFIKTYIFLKKISINEYDLVYIDRANVNSVFLLKYIFNKKTILRLHGIGKTYRNFNKSRTYRLKNILKIYAYKLHFSSIIGTNDGTPISLFMEEYTNKNSPKYIWTNGVDLNQIINNKKNKSSINFLFVGRLEEDKGINELVDVFKNYNENKSITLRIIGDGALKESIKETIKSNINIEYIGSVNHNQINDIYESSDILISFNFLGNISNVVLEAISHGLAIVTFKEDINDFSDVDTNKFIENNAIYVDKHDLYNSFNSVIERVIHNPDLVYNYRNRVIKNLIPKLYSWEDRIQKEINILSKIKI
jgi:glycosyltransferase involved in cell wall biosynthesis